MLGIRTQNKGGRKVLVSEKENWKQAWKFTKARMS